MKTKAAIAWKAGAPLTIEEVDLEGPRAGEVLIEVKAPAFATPTITRSRARIRKASSRQFLGMKVRVLWSMSGRA
jgi:Zn-dependent alcohol dehydrogenase